MMSPAPKIPDEPKNHIVQWYGIQMESHLGKCHATGSHAVTKPNSWFIYKENR